MMCVYALAPSGSQGIGEGRTATRRSKTVLLGSSMWICLKGNASVLTIGEVSLQVYSVELLGVLCQACKKQLDIIHSALNPDEHQHNGMQSRAQQLRIPRAVQPHQLIRALFILLQNPLNGDHSHPHLHHKTEWVVIHAHSCLLAQQSQVLMVFSSSLDARCTGHALLNIQHEHLLSCQAVIWCLVFHCRFTCAYAFWYSANLPAGYNSSVPTYCEIHDDSNMY